MTHGHVNALLLPPAPFLPPYLALSHLLSNDALNFHWHLSCDDLFDLNHFHLLDLC